MEGLAPSSGAVGRSATWAEQRCQLLVALLSRGPASPKDPSSALLLMPHQLLTVAQPADRAKGTGASPAGTWSSATAGSPPSLDGPYLGRGTILQDRPWFRRPRGEAGRQSPGERLLSQNPPLQRLEIPSIRPGEGSEGRSWLPHRQPAARFSRGGRGNLCQGDIA